MSAVRLFSLLVILFFAACSKPPEPRAPQDPVDIFSYGNFNQVVVRHVDLDLTADFDTKTLAGSATLTVEVLDPTAKELILDDGGLVINDVEVSNGGGFTRAQFTIGDNDPVMGTPLTIDIPKGVKKVRIDYKTSPGAGGLQWLSPEQTGGKQYPFMYSQDETIYTRTWVPLQDSPSVRITYAAHIKTPPELRAVMSAEQDPDAVRDGDYTFTMPQAVPTYLMAIAIGDLDFRRISDRAGVYAEPGIVDAAAEEFSDTPAMIAADEALFGPYKWGRYDLLILPPSYPFGGMENPRLTFLTPTVIVGDKSGTAVIAHELSHSWAGNQVTNATWREPWLNEGMTTYVEYRVLEAVYGKESAAMDEILEKADWMRDLADLKDPAMGALKLPEKFANPDDAFSNVAYGKGSFFMLFLEQKFGRDVFDPFLKGYFDHFAFQSITTEDFLNYLEENLLDKHPGVVPLDEVKEWLYKADVPADTPNPVSEKFNAVDAKRTSWLAGGISLNDLGAADWSTQEWLRFINALPDDLEVNKFAALDKAYHLSTSANAEIAFAWYMKSLSGGYDAVLDPLHNFLVRIGRGKFINPLYTKLIDTGHRGWAANVFAEAKPGYHPISQARIEAIFEGK